MGWGEWREAIRWAVGLVAAGLGPGIILGAVLSGVTMWLATHAAMDRQRAILRATEAQLVACQADRAAEHETVWDGILEGASDGE